MTLEERVRRIEEWIIAPNLKAGLRIRDAIRASLDEPFPDSPEATAHLSFREQLALQIMRNFPAISVDDLLTRIRAIEAEVDAPRDEAREDAAHDRANEIQMRAERDAAMRRAMAAESERDVLREEHTDRVLENADLARERDAARAAFHSQVDKHAAVCGELAQCQHALTQVERERDSLRAQLADAHRVLAQGETIDAATERDTREKMERLERGVREAARLLRSDNRSYLEERIALRASWLREFGS